MSKNPTPAEIVQSMYAAFSRGDIPAILARLTDNVDWRLNANPASPGAGQIDAFRRFRGPAGVGEFFTGLARDLEFHSFQPVAFLSGGQEVAARVEMEWTVRRTGRRMQIESMHHFTFDAAGRLVKFHEFTDTLAVAQAHGVIKAAG